MIVSLVAGLDLRPHAGLDNVRFFLFRVRTLLLRGVPMPRRSILSSAERDSLVALPDAKDEFIRHYTFTETDLSIILQHRGPANRLGFAVQLCYMAEF